VWGTAQPDRPDRAGPAVRDPWRRVEFEPADVSGSEGGLGVETVIGLGLVVIAALEIWFIIRVVSSNLKIGG